MREHWTTAAHHTVDHRRQLARQWNKCVKQCLECRIANNSWFITRVVRTWMMQFIHKSVRSLFRQPDRPKWDSKICSTHHEKTVDWWFNIPRSSVCRCARREMTSSLLQVLVIMATLLASSHGVSDNSTCPVECSCGVVSGAPSADCSGHQITDLASIVQNLHPDTQVWSTQCSVSVYYGASSGSELTEGAGSRVSTLDQRSYSGWVTVCRWINHLGN